MSDSDMVAVKSGMSAACTLALLDISPGSAVTPVSLEDHLSIREYLDALMQIRSATVESHAGQENCIYACRCHEWAPLMSTGYLRLQGSNW